MPLEGILSTISSFKAFTPPLSLHLLLIFLSLPVSKLGISPRSHSRVLASCFGHPFCLDYYLWYLPTLMLVSRGPISYRRGKGGKEGGLYGDNGMRRYGLDLLVVKDESSHFPPCESVAALGGQEQALHTLAPALSTLCTGMATRQRARKVLADACQPARIPSPLQNRQERSVRCAAAA